jgi:hypothetical protein
MKTDFANSNKEPRMKDLNTMRWTLRKKQNDLINGNS